MRDIFSGMALVRMNRPIETGRRLKELRLAAGLTQVQLAAASGITQGTLSELERGQTPKPEAETILKLASALATSPYYLMAEEREALPESSMARLAPYWHELTPEQRDKVIAYAQGLADSRRGGPRPRPKPPSGAH